MSIRETIEWFEVTERMPDDDVTVLICMPGENEPVWLGWHEDGCWYSVDAVEIPGVQCWAEMPIGNP